MGNQEGNSSRGTAPCDLLGVHLASLTASDISGPGADLSGTGDIRINLDNEDYEAARLHRRRYEEDMRLLDDLCWEPDQDRDEFEITMDQNDLARVMRRVNRSAGETLHIYVVEALEGEFVTRAASTQAAVGDAFAQIVDVEDDDERPSGDDTGGGDGDR